jgi:hypothetical protein
MATLPPNRKDAASLPASSPEAFMVARSKIDVIISYPVSILLSVGVFISFTWHCRRYTVINDGGFHVEVSRCGNPSSRGIIG